MSFVASVGLTNVDLLYAGMPRVPNEGEEVFSADFSMQLGGGAPGTMMTVSRLGIPSRIGTWLGEDVFSVFAAEEFRKNGVSPINLYHGTGIPVNVTSVMLTAANRTFATYNSGCPLDDAVQEQAYRLSTGARVVQMQPGLLPVYRKLKEEGTVLVFDIGWDDEMSLQKYEEYLRLADCFTPNCGEALKITGASTPEEAARILGDYFETPLVKLDREGCLLLEDGKPFVVPPIPGIRSVDSTGAGDAFLAGLIYGIYHGKSLRESVLYGNITGGKCVTEIGCLTGWVNETELLQLAAQHHGLIE